MPSPKPYRPSPLIALRRWLARRLDPSAYEAEPPTAQRFFGTWR